ncbi:MAG: hypothetical protein ACLQLO_04200 [Mycobacterium sp.]
MLNLTMPRNLVVAMLIAQVIAPGSKLATARGLRAETATSSLGQVLGVAGCDEETSSASTTGLFGPGPCPAPPGSPSWPDGPHARRCSMPETASGS